MGAAGGIAVIVIFGTLWIIDRRQNKSYYNYYSEKARQARITGDDKKADEYLNYATSFRRYFKK